MGVQRFWVARRALVALYATAAALAFVIAAASLVTELAWGYRFVFLLHAAALGSVAFISVRQTIVLTEDEIVATQGFRRQRVAWDDVERVVLDWAAEAAGHDREVLRVEQRSGTTVRSSAPMGMGGSIDSSEAAHLESALRDRAAAHGFAVEATFPSWSPRGSDAGGA